MTIVSSWTAAEDAKLVSLWIPGRTGRFPTDAELAMQLYPRSPSAVGSRRRHLRLVSNLGRRWTDAERNLCIGLRKAGVSDEEIARQVDRSVESVRDQITPVTSTAAPTAFLHLSNQRSQRYWAAVACTQHLTDLVREYDPVDRIVGAAKYAYRNRCELDIEPTESVPNRIRPEATHVPTSSTLAA